MSWLRLQLSAQGILNTKKDKLKSWPFFWEDKSLRNVIMLWQTNEWMKGPRTVVRWLHHWLEVFHIRCGSYRQEGGIICLNFWRKPVLGVKFLFTKWEWKVSSALVIVILKPCQKYSNDSRWYLRTFPLKNCLVIHQEKIDKFMKRFNS